KSISREGVTTYGIHIPEEVNVAPGKEIELYELKLDLKPPREKGNARVAFETLEGTGKFQIQYERVFGNSSSGTIKLDPAMSKLATGKLELEVKEAFTAWGKEVEGVQAGLGFPVGQKREYHTGETAKLVVRVRNGGKKDVKFVYAWESFYEQPPVV